MNAMFILIVGGGKVGSSLGRILKGMGYEISIVEGRSSRFDLLQREFEDQVHFGDGTEIFVLEQAGMARADMVVAVTGDDEDNIVIGQIAREKFGVDKIIARVNNPRNQQTFDLLGIAPTVSATTSIISLIEHEVPEHKMVHLLDLRNEGLAVVDMEVPESSRIVGQQVSEVPMPEGARIIAVFRETGAFLPKPDTVIEPHDRVLVILSIPVEQDVRRVFVE